MNKVMVDDPSGMLDYHPGRHPISEDRNLGRDLNKVMVDDPSGMLDYHPGRHPISEDRNLGRDLNKVMVDDPSGMLDGNAGHYLICEVQQGLLRLHKVKFLHAVGLFHDNLRVACGKHLGIRRQICRCGQHQRGQNQDGQYSPGRSRLVHLYPEQRSTSRR
ncbi:MAG: hypothetical protein DDT25_00781 [Chloroflexi bacterium]|nr:hypothetical protein [Chloroflexota bacterium]